MKRRATTWEVLLGIEAERKKKEANRIRSITTTFNVKETSNEQLHCGCCLCQRRRRSSSRPRK